MSSTTPDAKPAPTASDLSHHSNPATLAEKPDSLSDAKDKPTDIDAGRQSEGEVLPTGIRLYLIMTGLFLAVFIAALDQTIIAPAIPIISNDFKDTSAIGWYISAYFLTSSTLLPLFGRFYRFNLKWVFLGCIVIFEVGSLITALAQGSSTFIVGRAVAGVGVAGAYLGVMTIIAASVPLDKKSFWAGNVGAAYGLGAVAGPLIGGAFTTHVSWRWCFWINLPIGGFTIATVLLFFHPPPRPPMARGAIFKSLLRDIDWVGTALLLGSMCCILLALQDGGIKRPWSDSQSIGLIVGFIVILMAFAGWQVLLGDRALLPPRLFTHRTIFFGSIVNLCVGSAYFIVLSFLPIYFQITGSSALRSGVQMLPIICGVVFSVTITGGVAPKVGYVQPFLFFGLPAMSVFAGVLSLLKYDSSQAFWAGVSFCFGLGAGSSWQFAFIAAQAIRDLEPLDLEQGASITLFFQIFGGSALVAVGQSIYQNLFHDGIVALDGLPNAAAVAAAGETAFRQLVPPEFILPIEIIANDAVTKTFILAAAIAAVGTPFILGLEWNSLKGLELAAGGA